jgi:ATP-dependent RNA circularization protein (DNA/RNA ligase family)
MFTVEKLARVFSYAKPGEEIVLYGEGYGPGINKGHKYSDEVGFALFDVMFDNGGGALPLWAKRDAVIKISESLGCEVVRSYGTMSIMEARMLVSASARSFLAASHGKDEVFEGIVARPITPLMNQKHEPLMWKLKVKDFE